MLGEQKGLYNSQNIKLKGISEQVIIEEKQHKQLLKRLAEQLERENHPKVLNIVNKLLKIDPNNIQLLQIKTNACCHLGKNELGLKTVEKILKLDPEDKIGNTIRGDFLKELGRTKEALVCYNKAIADFPEDYSLDFRNISLMERLDYNEDSLNFLKELLEENPYNTEAYMIIGYIYNILSKHEEALEYFDKHIEKKRERYDMGTGSHVYLQKSETLRALKRYDEALKIANKILEVEGEAPEYYIEKALIYKEIGKYDEALSLFDKAIEVDPGYNHPIEEKGKLYFEIKKYDEAIICFETILEGSENPEITYLMGMALKHKKEYNEAIEYLNKVNKNPYHDEYFLNAQKAIEEIKNKID